MDDLIGKYLAGEASPDEMTLVDQWIVKSEDNEKYFKQLETIFKQSSSIKGIQQFDTDAAWIRMKEALSDGGKVVNMPVKPGSNSWFWKVAASIIFISAVGIYIYRQQSADSELFVPVVFKANNTSLADTLPDGSKIFMNKATELIYAFNSDSKEHVVKLKGEAYFDIKHEENKSLVLDIDGVFIRDVGTSFNVKAYPDSSTIEVVVEEGEVKFYTATDSGVYLKKQGKAVYDKATKKFTLDLPEVNALSYKTRQFNFENTSLKKVVETLNAVYGKNIVLDKKLEQCRLTVDFNNESLDEITAVIAETLGATIKQSADNILLEGNGCETP